MMSKYTAQVRAKGTFLLLLLLLLTIIQANSGGEKSFFFFFYFSFAIEAGVVLGNQ